MHAVQQIRRRNSGMEDSLDAIVLLRSADAFHGRQVS